jgi:hypothetical protein
LAAAESSIDGSRREIVGAEGFPDRHFDTEALAGCGWRMDGRKLLVRSLGKPVYLYGFRFVPYASAEWPATGKALRWLATAWFATKGERRDD